ncbi:MAG TPA: EamA/RhaT family transporter, partial [Rhodospirillaceae bacterium]|nr:EamA/RhaT family transporter [Rhodospirillaceae bacterium]
HSFQIGFLRSVFGLIFLLPIILRGWEFSDLRVKRPKLHIIRGALSAVNTLAWFTALAIMPLGEAVALNFTSPLFATVLAALFLGEVVRARRWVATVIGFIGVLIVVRPGGETVQLGAILALGSALSIAVNVLLIRVMSQEDSTRAIVTTFNLAIIVFTFIPAIMVWASPSPAMWAVTFAVGVSTTVAHLMLTKAMSLAEASAIVPLEFIRLPMAVLIGFVWFAEILDGWTILGATIIGCSAVYIARREAIASKPTTDITAT